MGYWNYRVVRQTIPHLGKGGEETEDLFEIKEVFYEDDGSIRSYTIDGMNPSGETKRELRRDLELMLEALEKPTLRQEVIDKIIEDREKGAK